MLDYGDRTFSIPNLGMKKINEERFAALGPKPDINLKDVYIQTA